MSDEIKDGEIEDLDVDELDSKEAKDVIGGAVIAKPGTDHFLNPQPLPPSPPPGNDGIPR